MSMHQQSEHDHGHEQQIERWLDDALAHYVKIEPRPGLEERVLARLELESEESIRKLRSWGMLAFSMAGVLAMAILWWAGVEHKSTVEMPDAKISAPPSSKAIAKAGHAASLPRSSDRQSGKANKSARAVYATARTGKEPKLEHFPSDLPLTDQEKMLALYVRGFPEKAAIVAGMQTEIHRQDELEMARPWPGRDESNLQGRGNEEQE